MKKLILIAGLVLGASVGYCVDQPQNIGYVKTDGPVGFWGQTLAQMNQLTPITTGYVLHVTDATRSRLCISSGTTKGAWVIITATGTFEGASYPHCQ